MAFLHVEEAAHTWSEAHSKRVFLVAERKSNVLKRIKFVGRVRRNTRKCI